MCMQVFTCCMGTDNASEGFTLGIVFEQKKSQEFLMSVLNYMFMLQNGGDSTKFIFFLKQTKTSPA